MNVTQTHSVKIIYCIPNKHFMNSHHNHIKTSHITTERIQPHASYPEVEKRDERYGDVRNEWRTQRPACRGSQTRTRSPVDRLCASSHRKSRRLLPRVSTDILLKLFNIYKQPWEAQ